MNPNTKLTTDQLKIICARHVIPYISHARINSGFSHEVHRLNDNLVIKLFNTTKPKRFTTELALLSSDLPFLKPQLLASHESKNSTERSYIIMSYVPGVSLGSKWHEANDNQRQSLIKAISQTLKTINQLEVSALGLGKPDPWHISVQKRGNELVDKLVGKNIIDKPTAEKASQTLAKNSTFLVGSKLYPVYWDIHFDNFIVNESFELQAIIDLETVDIASLDYPLFVVQKQTNMPHKYLREEDEKYADPKDYIKLKDWYKEYYPEMFAFDNLDTRVRTYQLLDALHLLIDWSHNEETQRELRSLIEP